jgi:hypothetical protein
MASVIWDTQAAIWIASLHEVPCYAGVHFEMPTPDNPLASECTSGSYARSPLTWTYSAVRTITNLQAMEWLNLEDTTIIGIGAWDAPAGGQLRVFFQLDDPIPIAGRGSWQLSAQQLYVHI